MRMGWRACLDCWRGVPGVSVLSFIKTGDTGEGVRPCFPFEKKSQVQCPIIH